MPSLKVIRTRIVSVKSTQKITKAMKMVAGARLNRAQQAITALRPYAVKTGEMLRSVAGGAAGDAAAVAPGPAAPAGADGAAETTFDEGAALHPFLAQRPVANALIVLFTADRGLCGAFNTNVNKLAERRWRELEREGKKVSFVTVGRKGKEYIARRGGTNLKDFPKPYEGLDMAKASAVAAFIAGRYRAKEIDAVYVVFNEFKSAMTQKATLSPLLPLTAPAPADAPPPANVDPHAPAVKAADNEPRAEFLFEPDKPALLRALVPMYIEVTLFRAMLESQAGFFGAQMTAMDSATRNAKDMIKRLSLAYNRARQAAITKELMEIIGGAEALKE
jgi:F-type H+-transporting ATPase subunit gamma